MLEITHTSETNLSTWTKTQTISLLLGGLSDQEKFFIIISLLNLFEALGQWGKMEKVGEQKMIERGVREKKIPLRYNMRKTRMHKTLS